MSDVLNSLIEVGTIIYEPWAETLPVDEDDGDSVYQRVSYCLDKSRLPSYERLTLWDTAYPHSPGPALKSVAEDCAGCSGRKLVKLPFLAIAKYTRQGRCTIFDAIQAIEKAVKLDKATN